ncbi:NADH-quinone oxidoreductase subunit C [Thiothrix eikelboomii]|uniref:NADH-quinone oxidoreductase subunit C n=1 Tax=Thiothrix eikelboomii TaxID=92487 RepID=UPI003BAF06A5
MTEKLAQIHAYLQTQLSEQLSAIKYEFNELTLELPVAHWLAVAEFLRQDERLACHQLIDLCGVDYLTFGDAEWDVTTASRRGFSRAVQSTEADALFEFAQPKSSATLSYPRYAVVVHVLSVQHNFRLRLRTWAENNDLPLIPSLVPIWNAANWFEREAFDLFGILFTGHPDLRRILTDYGFVGHPFRKDFPLIGQVEMFYDPELKRVAYKPVSIEARVLVPRVIR